MATPTLTTYTVASGQTIYGGRFSGGGGGGGSVAGFGSGAATGTMATNIWTPGRDTNGVVNFASWNIVPSNSWTKISGSRLDGLQSQVVAALPSWRDYGTWHGVTAGWSSCAVDPLTGRMWLFGGGHSDSSNNGIYCFDVYKMGWAIESLPSDTASWSSSYAGSGSYTNCGESSAAEAAAKIAGTWTTVNDWFYDEVYWDHGIGIGKPTARHSYNTFTYASNRNELVFPCRRLWVYSLTSHAWTYKRIFKDNESYVHDGEEGAAWYDPSVSEIVSCAGGSSGVFNTIAFNLATQAFTTTFSPWEYWTTKTQDQVGNALTIVRPPGNNHSSGPQDYLVWDVVARTITSSGTWQLAGGLTGAMFDGNYEMPTLIQVPSINRYWMLTRMATGDHQWFEINPTTTPWTFSPKTFTGDVPIPPNGYSQPGRKGMYVAAINAVVFFYDANIEHFVYKL